MQNISKLVWFPMVVLCFGQVVTTFDNELLLFSVSFFTEQFSANFLQIQFLQIIYPLVTAGSVLVFAMLGLVVSWTFMFRLGLLLIAIGNFITTFAPDLSFIYLARFLAGIGGGMLAPSIIALVTTIIPPEKRGLVFGLLGASLAFGTAFMTIFFGILVEHVRYEFTYFFNGVFFSFIFLMALFLPPTTPPRKNIKFDWFGSILSTILMINIMLIINFTPDWGFFYPTYKNPYTPFGVSIIFYMFMLLVILGGVFFWFEKRFEQKYGTCIFPNSFISNKKARIGLILSLGLYLSFGGFAFLIVNYAQIVLSYSLLKTGLLLLIFSLGIVASIIGNKITKKMHITSFLRIALLLSVVGNIIVVFGFEKNSFNLLLEVGLLIITFGATFLMLGVPVLITTAINPSDAQQSGGIQVAARQAGKTFGIALAGIVMITSLTNSFKESVNQSQYINQNVKELINSSTTINFLSDKDMKDVINNKNNEISTKAQEEIIEINRNSRLVASQKGIFVSNFIYILFFLLTFLLPKKEEKEKH